MTVYICLLRGVNVLGHNKVTMAELRRTLDEAGLGPARTYVQSGNVVLRSRAGAAALARRVETVLSEGLGIAPRVLARRREDFDAAVAACPYAREAARQPTSVHALFLERPPAPAAAAALAAVASSRDRHALLGEVLYLHTPDGFARSKLAAAAERKLGVATTARNWRSVLALQALAAEVAAGA